MTPNEEIGYELAKGAVNYICRMLAILFILVGLFSFARLLFGWGMNSTDKDKWHRSGLTLHIDHRTGIQYLSDGKGGLVRREYRRDGE